MKKDNKYLSIPEVAKILGISRIAVYKRVKKGDIESIRVGNQYVISDSRVSEIIGKATSPAKQKKIELAIKRFVEEYRDLIIRLGDE